jgi:hypothetical protein
MKNRVYVVILGMMLAGCSSPCPPPPPPAQCVAPDKEAPPVVEKYNDKKMLATKRTYNNGFAETDYGFGVYAVEWSGSDWGEMPAMFLKIHPDLEIVSLSFSPNIFVTRRVENTEKAEADMFKKIEPVPAHQ